MCGSYSRNRRGVTSPTHPLVNGVYAGSHDLDTCGRDAIYLGTRRPIRSTSKPQGILPLIVSVTLRVSGIPLVVQHPELDPGSQRIISTFHIYVVLPFRSNPTSKLMYLRYMDLGGARPRHTFSHTFTRSHAPRSGPIRFPHATARFDRDYRTLRTPQLIPWSKPRHHDRVPAPRVRPWLLIDAQLSTLLIYNGAALLHISGMRHEVGMPWHGIQCIRCNNASIQSWGPDTRYAHLSSSPSQWPCDVA